MRAFLAAGFAATLTFAGAAKAETGHIPYIWFGVAGGVTIGGINYTRTNMSGDTSFIPATEDESQSVVGGMIGPEVRLRLDEHVLLLYADGFYNVVDAPLQFVGHGGLIFAAGPGGRSTMKLAQPAGTGYEGGEKVEYTKVYTGKDVPAVYGLELGYGVYSQRAVDTTADFASIDSNGNSFTPTLHRDATLRHVVEAGFAFQSGQLELLIAAGYEISTRSAAGRAAFMYAAPIGSIPLYFRFSVDQIFGDQVIGTVVLGALGIGSGMGVSAN